MNFDFDYAQKINLTFRDRYKVKVIQNAKDNYYETKNMTLDLGAGEGALIVFE